MTVERHIFCDGPDCERWVRTLQPPPHQPHFLLITEQTDTGARVELWFCGWDCVLRHAMQIEPETIIRMDEEGTT